MGEFGSSFAAGLQTLAINQYQRVMETNFPLEQAPVEDYFIVAQGQVVEVEFVEGQAALFGGQGCNLPMVVAIGGAYQLCGQRGVAALSPNRH